MHLKLIYLQEQEIETPAYISFYEKYHGIGAFLQRRDRIHWYFQSGGYKLLVAIVDEQYVGQSCAYRATAVVNGVEHEWWWGVDTFALSEMQGKGIGKALQRKLHEDCPNFASASYSAINGIIKKKCGGHEVLGYHQFYYPVSCWISLYAELAAKKVLSRRVTIPRIRMPYLYSLLNQPQALRDYTINKLTPNDYNSRLSSFFEDCLKTRSFYIKRSDEYLKWKYLYNPSVKYVGLKVEKEDRLEGIIFFTEVYNGKYTISKARVCKILDAVIRPGSALTQKDLLAYVVQYFKQKDVSIDGLLSLIPVNYRPKIQYPASSPTHMLSTLDTTMLTAGYLALSDQDMEQMYEYEG